MTVEADRKTSNRVVVEEEEVEELEEELGQKRREEKHQRSKEIVLCDDGGRSQHSQPSVVAQQQQQHKHTLSLCCHRAGLQDFSSTVLQQTRQTDRQKAEAADTGTHLFYWRFFTDLVLHLCYQNLSVIVIENLLKPSVL